MRLACEQSQSQPIKSLNDFWESSRLMFCETLCEKEYREENDSALLLINEP